MVAKAHPAHPLLSDRLAGLARTALLDAGAPDGSLEMVVGYDAGVALVRDEGVAALAFTGSQAAGLALVAHSERAANGHSDIRRNVDSESRRGHQAAAATRMEEIAEGLWAPSRLALVSSAPSPVWCSLQREQRQPALSVRPYGRPRLSQSC